MKVMTVLGARPQFVKAAAVSFLLRQDHTECLVHTGQHFDFNMSEIFFKELGIPVPNYDLGVSGGGHSAQTGLMMIKLEKVIMEEKPDALLVYGDTNSTLAGALVASKLSIPVAHVEAGLRSFDRSMPEEINRIIVDRLSSILFAPTKTAMKNLKNEGMGKKAFLIGDVMFDIFCRFESIIKSGKNVYAEKLGLKSKAYNLLTIHRQSNVDNRKNLKAILEGLESSGETFVFPVHPRTKAALKEVIFDNVLKEFGKRLKRVDPVSYIDFLRLLANARSVITDSGGAQKEAYMLKIPCITIRANTEWVETVDAGWNQLVDIQTDKIRLSVKKLKRGGRYRKFYGNGKAGVKIVEMINRELSYESPDY